MSDDYVDLSYINKLKEDIENILKDNENKKILQKKYTECMIIKCKQFKNTILDGKYMSYQGNQNYKMLLKQPLMHMLKCLELISEEVSTKFVFPVDESILNEAVRRYVNYITKRSPKKVNRLVQNLVFYARFNTEISSLEEVLDYLQSILRLPINATNFIPVIEMFNVLKIKAKIASKWKEESVRAAETKQQRDNPQNGYFAPLRF